MNEPPAHRLVIYTLGSSAEPITASILNQAPAKIIFIPSPETAYILNDAIVPLLEKEGHPLKPADYEVKKVADSQNFESCVKTIRELKPRVDEWTGRGGDYTVAVDITGGTKCMSAALALVARPWASEFIYVGGSERAKEGIGVVVSGKEQILHSSNPWNSLGYQTAEEATLFFDQGNFLAAISSIKRALPKISDSLAKRELSSLKQLAEAYELWDCFDHKGAKAKFDDILKNLNNLVHLTQKDRTSLEQLLSKHYKMVCRLALSIPSVDRVVDLIANARRRASQGRYDDAVARLYRAIEAIAQLRLLERYGITTADVAPDSLPEAVRGKWIARKTGQKLKLSLQADYELLRDLGDGLATSFDSLDLESNESALGLRNNSILAHGFDPVGKDGFAGLWKRTLALCDVEEQKLPEFPQLGQ